MNPGEDITKYIKILGFSTVSPGGLHQITRNLGILLFVPEDCSEYGHGLSITIHTNNYSVIHIMKKNKTPNTSNQIGISLYKIFSD